MATSAPEGYVPSESPGYFDNEQQALADISIWAGLKKNSFAGGGGHSSPFPPPPKGAPVTEPFSDISDSLRESESNKVGPPNKGGTSKRGALINEKG